MSTENKVEAELTRHDEIFLSDQGQEGARKQANKSKTKNKKKKTNTQGKFFYARLSLRGGACVQNSLQYFSICEVRSVLASYSLGQLQSKY